MEPAAVRELVLAARSGDRAAWDELVAGFSGLVWSVIRSVGLFGAEAADVSQTVWLRFVEHLDRLREPEHAAAWLATTARNEARRVAKRTSRQVPTDDLEERLDAAGARVGGPGLGGGTGQDALDHELLRGEAQVVVLEALALLSEHCRTLLRLLFADPALSYDEICSVLGMPKGSIGPTRGRCLARLRDELVERGITG